MESEVFMNSDSSGSEDSDFSSDDEGIPAVLPPAVLAALHSGTAHQKQQYSVEQQQVTRIPEPFILDDDDGYSSSSDDEQPERNQGFPAPTAAGSSALSSNEHQRRSIFNDTTVTAEDGTSETLYRVFWRDQPPTWEPAAAMSAEELKIYSRTSLPYWVKFNRVRVQDDVEVILDSGKLEMWFYCHFVSLKKARERPGTLPKRPTWIPIGHVPPEALERYAKKVASERDGQGVKDGSRKPPVPINQLTRTDKMGKKPVNLGMIIDGHTDTISADGTIERWYRTRKRKTAKSPEGKQQTLWKPSKDVPKTLVTRYLSGDKVQFFTSKNRIRKASTNAPDKTRQADGRGKNWMTKLKDEAKGLQEEIKNAKVREKTRDSQIQALQKELDYQLRLRDAYLLRNEESNVRALESELHKVRWQLQTQPSPNGQMTTGGPNVQALEAEIANLRWQLESRPHQVQCQTANLQAPEAQARAPQWQLHPNPQAERQMWNAHVFEAEIYRLQWRLDLQPKLPQGQTQQAHAIEAEMQQLRCQMEWHQRAPQFQMPPASVQPLMLERQVPDPQQGQLAQRDALEQQIRDLQGQLAQRDATITKLSALYGESGTMYALNAMETTQETSAFGTTQRSYHLEPVPRAKLQTGGFPDTAQYLSAPR